MPWFPAAVGVTAALAIAPLRFLLKQKLLDLSSNDWFRIVLFLFCGLAPIAALPFLGHEDALLIVGLTVMSALRVGFVLNVERRIISEGADSR